MTSVITLAVDRSVIKQKYRILVRNFVRKSMLELKFYCNAAEANNINVNCWLVDRVHEVNTHEIRSYSTHNIPSTTLVL